MANVYASPYTPEFCDWAFAYEIEGEDRFNDAGQTLEGVGGCAGNPIPSRRPRASGMEDSGSGSGNVDIVITHGPPYKRLDPTASVPAVGCPLLLRAVMRARPKLCCFGHIHEGWGAERVRWAEGVAGVAEKKCSVAEWKDRIWEEGVEGVERVGVDLEDAKERRAVFVDASASASASGQSERMEIGEDGEETLFVNAAIMDVAYRPVNAPWVVDLELPNAGLEGHGV